MIEFLNDKSFNLVFYVAQKDYGYKRLKDFRKKNLIFQKNNFQSVSTNYGLLLPQFHVEVFLPFLVL